MRFTLLTQITLLTLSVAIIFFFIKPALAEIKIIQDDLLVYSDAVAKAEEYNNRLQELISDRDSFSSNDLAKLEQFIPSSIDAVAIMHEIESIFASRNIKLDSLSTQAETKPVVEFYTEGEVVPENQPTGVTTQDFEVKFSGDYNTLKTMLGLLEANARLLEIMSVGYGTAVDTEATTDEANNDTSESDGQSFTIVLRAYALEDPSVVQSTQ